MATEQQGKPLHHYTMVESCHYGMIVNILRRDAEAGRAVRGEFLADIQAGAIRAPLHPRVEQMQQALVKIADLACSDKVENLNAILEIAIEFVSNKPPY